MKPVQVGPVDVLRGQQEQEEEGEVGRRVADELDEGLPDEQAQRALWGDQVAHGEDREQEPDDEARHHLHGPVSPPPARELVVPARGQQLLAVGLGHELFLTILNGQFQSCKVISALLFQEAVVVPVVQDDFQLPGAPRLVQQVLGKLLALSGQLLVLGLELVLHLAQLLQLPAQLKGCEEGVLTGQRDEGGAGQGLVDVESGAGVAQAVHVGAGHALHAVAADLMRSGHGDPFLNQEFDDLVVICVGCQNDGGDVRSEFRELLVQEDGGHLLFPTGLLVVQQQLHGPHDLLPDGVQQSVAHVDIEA